MVLNNHWPHLCDMSCLMKNSYKLISRVERSIWFKQQFCNIARERFEAKTGKKINKKKKHFINQLFEWVKLKVQLKTSNCL